MKEAIKKISARFSAWYEKLPDKKKHVEFITALLSVPVMVTVIILNLNNLQQSKNAASKQTSPTTAPIQVVITGESGTKQPPPPSPTPLVSVSPTPTPTVTQCKQEIGPVTILSPQEGEVVTTDPVCITITTDSSYCPITWSYSLNGGTWSAFTDKNICLYNLDSGAKTMQLKIKSSASDQVIELQRSFIYKNLNTTPSPATSSATTQ